MTWTERYLAAVLRSIPEPKRTDVERELRSSIDDAVEERVGSGVDRTTAERAVLEGLGDPANLAAAYTGRPNYLIGPELFPIYRRFLPRLIAIAAPIAGIVLALIQWFTYATPGDALLVGLNGALNVAIQIAFWSTVIFVVLEWAGPARDARAELVRNSGTWTLERLPKAPSDRITVTETAGEIVSVLITIGIVLFISGINSRSGADGSPIPLLAPSFASVWLPILIALIALRGLAHLVAYSVGRWTTKLVIYNTLVQLAFAIPLVVLAVGGGILNPRFGQSFGWLNFSDGNGIPMLLVAVGTVIGTGWEIIRIALRSRRQRNPTAQLDASPRSV
jgi:hypothetical protein